MMNRRTLIKQLGAGAVAGHFLQRRSSSESTASQLKPVDPKLETILPAAAILPDDFGANGPPITASTLQHVKWDADTTLSARYAKQRYGTSDVPSDHVGEVRARANWVRPIGHDDARTAYLENAIWRVLGGNPADASFNGWFETALETERVDDHRRTEHWQRAPQVYGPDLYSVPAALEIESDRPFIDYGLVLQTTDWGVLEAEAVVLDDPSEGASRQLARGLVEAMARAAGRIDVPEPQPIGEGDV